MSEAILKVENVSRIYKDDDEETVALLDANFEVQEGEFVSIIGASGCGKTTLLRMLAGLDPVKQGGITLRGEKITGPDPKRGYAGMFFSREIFITGLP